MSRPPVLLLALAACTPEPAPSEGCPEATRVVQADLQEAIDAATPGDVLHVTSDVREGVRIDRPVVLVGLDEAGRCVPPLGEGGPLLSGLELADGADGAEVLGLRVAGPVVVHAPARLQDVSAAGADTCFDVDAAATLERILGTDCDTGLAVGGGATVHHAVLARHRGDGVVVDGAADVSFLTSADNGGDGLVVSDAQARVSNAVLVGNGGYGVHEHTPATALLAFTFQGNTEGLYHRDGAAPTNMPLRMGPEGASFPVLLPEDRLLFAIPLANDGIRRFEALPARPFPPSDTPAGGPVALARAYQPAQPLLEAEADDLPTDDLLGSPRALDVRVGALASGTTLERPTQVLWVDPAGDDDAAGTADAPLATVAAAAERALPYQEVRVRTGRYDDPVYVYDRPIVLRGFKREGAAWVPITDPADPAMPVIDPSGSGRPQHGIYLQNVGHLTRVEGIAVEQAFTGITVMGDKTLPPPTPVLRWVRVSGSRKGLDSDQSAARLHDSLVDDSRIGAVFRAYSRWDVQRTRFVDNGISIAFQHSLTGPARTFGVRDNTFVGGDVVIDAVNAWPGSGYVLAGNRFEDASLVVHAGTEEAHVTVSGNDFRGPDARVLLDGPSWALPPLSLDDNHAEATPPVAVRGLGWDTPPPALDGGRHVRAPLALPPSGFTDADRTVGPHASPVALGPGGARIYAVASDFGGLAVFEPAPDGTVRRTGFVPTGRDPRALAVTPDGGLVLVANLGAGTVSFVDTASLEVTADVTVGVEPFGVAVDALGRWAYVTVEGDDAVVRLDVAGRRVTGRVDGLPAKPRGLAIWGDGPGQKLFVTHFAPEVDPDAPLASTEAHTAVVSVIDLPAFSRARRLALPPVSSERFPAAVPTLMQAAVPRGDRIYLPSFGATPERPTDAAPSGRPLLGFETTIQGLLTVLDARSEEVLVDETANLSTPGNPLSGPYHVAFDEDDTAYVTVYGNDCVSRFEVREGAPPVPIRAHRFAVDLFTGANPRGAALDPSRDRLYVVNFASGDLSVIDLATEDQIGRAPLGPSDRDKLSRLGRKGKQLFYAANRVAVTANFWITCGTCHPDGRIDGVVWDFDAGPRTTTALASSVWTLPLHFDADRDEVDDFEHTVRDLQGGFSLAAGDPGAQLGARLSDRDTPWAAINTYLAEGIDSPRGREESQASARGREVFRRLGCTTCHGGEYFTTSRLPEQPEVVGVQMTNTLRDIGTKRPHDLIVDAEGFDPPSLWGVHQTGPYLHDGTAPTLADVVADPRHALAGAPSGTAAPTPAEQRDLVAFLHTIDGDTPAVDDPLEPNDTADDAAALPTGTHDALVAAGEDWYRLDAPGDATLTVRWRDVGDELDVTLRAADDAERTLAPTPTDEGVAFEVPEGTWLLRLHGYGQGYTLDWQDGRAG